MFATSPQGNLEFLPCSKCGSTDVSSGISMANGRMTVIDPKCAVCATPLQVKTPEAPKLAG